MGAIVWLASYPKSGNTWLRAFLHNLLRDPAQPADINALDRFALGDSQKVWYQRVSDRPISELSLDALLALTPKVHALFTEASSDTVFVKTHNYLGRVAGQPLITMSATAGAIYVVRNPLDVTISVSHHYGISVDDAIDMLNFDQGATPEDHVNIQQFYDNWSAHVESWTTMDHGRLLVVRYEDLLAAPQRTFAGVARYLGLKPPRPRLEKAIRFSSFKVLKAQEQRNGFKERPVNAERFFRSGRAGEWRRALNQAQIGRLTEKHGKIMARFDYLP